MTPLLNDPHWWFEQVKRELFGVLLSEEISKIKFSFSWHNYETVDVKVVAEKFTWHGYAEYHDVGDVAFFTDKNV